VFRSFKAQAPTAPAAPKTPRLNPSNTPEAARACCQYSGTSSGVPGTNSTSVLAFKWSATSTSSCMPQPMPASAAVAKALGRGQGVAGQFHMPEAQAPRPAGLQFVLGAEHQAGRAGQGACRHALRKVARHEGGAGGGAVAHGAQGLAVAAGGGAGGGGNGGEHGAAAQPFGGVGFVVHGHLHQHGRLGREGGDGWGEPGGQAVGVYRHGQRHAGDAFRGQRGQGALQLLLQQAHAIHVLAQAPARVGGAAGLAAHHQGATHALFQQPDALGDGRGCDVQRARCALKVPLTDDGSQGGERGIVQHEFSFAKAGEVKTVCLYWLRLASCTA